jgi:hypothetical protein
MNQSGLHLRADQEDVGSLVTGYSYRSTGMLAVGSDHIDDLIITMVMVGEKVA